MTVTGWIVAAAAFAVAAVVFFLLGIRYRKRVAEKEISSAEEEATRIINEAIKSAETKKKEMLLEAKGFSDVVVSITEDNCDVVLNMGEVTDAKRAQVEDIVKRKTNVSAENVIITPIVVGEVDTE